MEWKPNKLIAVLLGLFTQSIAMLYLGRVKWAVFYFIAPLAVVVSEVLFAAPWFEFFSFTVFISIICAVHSYRIAASMPAVTARPWYSRWYGMTAIYLVYAIALLLLRAFIYEHFRMPSASMLPTINVGSHVIAAKYGYGNYEAFGFKLMQGEMTAAVRRGDLLVFQYPEDPSVSFVKRVIGLPGDTILFNNRKLTINEKPLKTKELSQPPEGSSATAGLLYVTETLDDVSYTVVYYPERVSFPFEVTIPENKYFVLGDNRDNSRDSRYFGFVPEENLVGKVVYVTSIRGGDK